MTVIHLSCRCESCHAVLVDITVAATAEGYMLGMKTTDQLLERTGALEVEGRIYCRRCSDLACAEEASNEAH